MSSFPLLMTPSERVSQEVEVQENFWQIMLEAIYRKRNPHKFHKVPALLEKYQGREAVLYRMVCQAYDLDPTKFYTDEAAWPEAQDEAGQEQLAPSRVSSIKNFMAKGVSFIGVVLGWTPRRKRRSLSLLGLPPSPTPEPEPQSPAEQDCGTERQTWQEGGDVTPPVRRRIFASIAPGTHDLELPSPKRPRFAVPQAAEDQEEEQEDEQEEELEAELELEFEDVEHVEAARLIPEPEDEPYEDKEGDRGTRPEPQVKVEPEMTQDLLGRDDRPRKKCEAGLWQRNSVWDGLAAPRRAWEVVGTSPFANRGAGASPGCSWVEVRPSAAAHMSTRRVLQEVTMTAEQPQPQLQPLKRRRT